MYGNVHLNAPRHVLSHVCRARDWNYAKILKTLFGTIVYCSDVHFITGFGSTYYPAGAGRGVQDHRLYRQPSQGGRCWEWHPGRVSRGGVILSLSWCHVLIVYITLSMDRRTEQYSEVRMGFSGVTAEVQIGWKQLPVLFRSWGWKIRNVIPECSKSIFSLWTPLKYIQNWYSGAPL